MKIITTQEIESLSIPPSTCVEWAKEAFLMKNETQLPPKVSLHPRGIDFFNTMPCILPDRYHTYGCKIVSRIVGNHPALKSDIIIYDTETGELRAFLNADWITAMRTGAVAALAINTLRKSDSQIYSFVGLGQIGHATLDCFLSTNENTPLTIRLKRYKDHSDKIISEYSKFSNVKFEIANSMEELVNNADVIVSCVTEAKELLVKDESLFAPGVLVVPVHTRGFQNCDTVFDKVFADDEGHVKGFRYFNEFRKFGEIGDVLSGIIPGRENNSERILSYNVGIGLHDVLYADKIIKLLGEQSLASQLL